MFKREAMENSGASALRSTEAKRRRVTRACDNCRLKKVKCDGRRPCIHCTVYLYNCSYDEPNIRNKKNSGIPLSLTLPARPMGNSVTALPGPAPASVGLAQSIVSTLLPKLDIDLLDARSIDLERLLKAVSYANLKGLPLLEVADLYSDGPVPSLPDTIFDRQLLVSSNDDVGQELRLLLPPKDKALQLIYTTWYKACVLVRFYHRPSLLEEVDLLYSLEPSAYTDRQQKFLPFLYLIFACGLLFSKQSNAKTPANDTLEDKGFKYFLEARKLIDVANISDIHSIQTVVMMIMYLQCLARISTCYLYVGIALRSAIKEGLHRNLSIFQSLRRRLDPIEIDTRKRLFYSIIKMDIYINSLLGLPRAIADDEYDQELPEELDDENITREACLYEEQGGRLLSSGCANHHTKLMFIVSRILRALYPIKISKDPDEKMTPELIHNRVTELELELKLWLDNLPRELRPTDPNNPESTRDIPEKFRLANYYMHLAFLNCQITLYRPFIHFISNGLKYQNSDPRSLIRGRNCIKVARMVVKLANTMIDQNLLVGTYWFSMYTIFFSIACLIYYYHFANYNHNGEPGNGSNYAGVLFDDDLNIDMIKKDIEMGKKVLDCLKSDSNASMRIFNILNSLFEQLNRRTANTSKTTPFPLLTQSAMQANDESVKEIFGNFEKINKHFRTGKTSVTIDRSNSADTTLTNDVGLLSLPGLPGSALVSENSSLPVAHDASGEGRSLNSFLMNYPTFRETTPSQGVQKEQPLQSPASIPTGDSSIYLPGAIDKLDTQIFGRILPPYMLQKNAPGEGVNFNGLDDAAQLLQSDAEKEVFDIDFDLTNLDDLGQLDYLDPFNPIQRNFENPSMC